MRKSLLLVASCFILYTSSLSGQDKPAAEARVVPQIILNGMEAYRNSGADAAVRAWLKGGPLDGDKDALGQASAMVRVEDFYGKFESFDVIGSHDVSPHVRYMFIVLNLEKGPFFTRFNLFKTSRDWIITSFDFNTKQDKIPQQ